MSIWKSPFEVLPTDGEEVWIRVISVYGELAIAIYDATNQVFTVDIIGSEIPLYMVSRWKEKTPAPPSTLLLDVYPTTDSAFSVFQLSENATLCMQVQRLSDDVVVDIGFVDGYLDTTTLLDFAGSDTVYVLIWYDQSGNNRNFYSIDINKRPVIVVGGTLVAANSSAGINFTRSTDLMLQANNNPINPNTQFLVCKQNTGFNPAVNRLISSYVNTSLRNGIFINPSNFYTINATTALISSANSDDSQVLLSAVFNGSSSYLKLNSSLIASGDIGASSPDQGRLLGGLSSSLPYDGIIQTIIYYNSDMTTDLATIETYINTLFSIY